MAGSPKQRKVGWWPELVVSNKETRQAIHEAVRRGELRRLASRTYSPNTRDDPARIIRRQWVSATSSFFPRAVISDRSAADPGLIVDGNVFVVHEGADRVLLLPGLAIHARRGGGPLDSDVNLGGVLLYRASDARLLVENLLPSRTRGGIRRRLTQREIEEYLDRQLRTHGEGWLKRVCDQIPGVAAALALPEEGIRAQALVREFLGTHTIKAQSGVLKARVRGTPFDPDRLQLFEILVEYLASQERRALEAEPEKQPEFSFFEAYFSNFIEGTEFELDEARRIVRTHEIPATRPKDAHDILGTYELVSDPSEMSRRPSTSNELIALLRERHRRLMSERPEVSPGGFKTANNQAGGTTFVSWELVEGTLGEGFDIGRSLVEPFARALYIMFLVAEVHPFADGNGRLARVFLNCELFAERQQRILVPTSRRGDYLNALRLMSRRRRPELLSRVMGDLQDYGASVDWSSFGAARTRLEADGAFEEISGESLDLQALEAAARQLANPAPRSK